MRWPLLASSNILLLQICLWRPNSSPCLSFSFHTVIFSGFVFYCKLWLFSSFRFVNGMVYYGVSYSSPFVGGNVYLNFFITSTVALVAYPALAWGCNRFVFYYNVVWAVSDPRPSYWKFLKAAFLFAMLTQFKTEILIVRKFIPK